MIDELKGSNFIGFGISAEGKSSFNAFAPGKNAALPGNFHYATSTELEKVLLLAEEGFAAYQKINDNARANFLDAIADEIMNLGDTLIERCTLETALPAARISGERARTCGQLKMFAQLLRDGWYADLRIDKAQPDRKPLPKSDIRRMLIGIGPVAVFGASNFPLAFSTAGGDTASALAAGCSVVVKAHSSHPGTNELISSAIITAAKKTGMPEGVFSSVYLSHDAAVKLVEHPTIKAVGFTGSRTVGMILFNAAVRRPDPIPMYAEMSSVNPLIILENILVNNEKIAKDLATSITMGVGQFCTNPGLIVVIDNDTSTKFLKELSIQINGIKPASMLNKNICKAYKAGVDFLQSSSSINLLGQSEENAVQEYSEARPVLHSISAKDFLANKDFSAEVFGPASLVVLCKTEDELLQVLSGMEGQLTATIHAGKGDEKLAVQIVDIMKQKAGRLIYGGYPTGVEVCHSMQHGGPFPSTTDARSTSVGTAAIQRFLRPVTFQDFPNDFLPDALKNENPLNALRLVDGEWSTTNW
ncbi:MAG: aldehyde dehydrogenase (NADP(+)) [Chitinophagaceae bacterium]